MNQIQGMFKDTSYTHSSADAMLFDLEVGTTNQHLKEEQESLMSEDHEPSCRTATTIPNHTLHYSKTAHI